MKKRIFHSLLSLVLMLAFPLLAAAGEKYVEQQLKAAITYNIAKFVNWPDHAFENERSPLRFCILGNIGFSKELMSLQDRLIGKRPIIIEHSASIADASDGHILVIASSERGRLDHIFSMLQQRPILTVSEMNGFAEQGGMINLVNVGKNIRFSINLDATAAAKLELSSKLHALATEIIKNESAQGQP
ncbi:MAG: hypothetical protein C0621_04405 [Desulfuromonas sp.]|nr:MAG: hypothetical protein C0621_04405 [Desulfuromonas sp.]